MSAARGWRAAIAAATALLLSACTTVPHIGVDDTGDALAGRLSIRVDADGTAPARSFSAAFELQGGPRAGRFDLLTPLGSVLAQARWSPDRVVLVTPKGETTFPDLDALTREVLGQSLPVAALFDWLRGRPWPGAPSTGIGAVAVGTGGTGVLDAGGARRGSTADTPETRANGAGGGAPSAIAPGFEQLGWTVDLARFDDALVSARRERPPPVSVRIKLDRP